MEAHRLKFWRELRDCPKCGATKGFACHKWEDLADCPQHHRVDPEPQLPDLTAWPGVLRDDE